MTAHLTQLLIPVILALVFIYLMIKYEDKKEQKTTEKIFEGRERLSKDEFYIRYYQQQGIPKEIVIGVIKTLEDTLGVDLSRLQPSDDFSGNLGYFFEVDDMADAEIAMSLKNDFCIQFSDEEASNACTIDDIIQLVKSKTQAS